LKNIDYRKEPEEGIGNRTFRKLSVYNKKDGAPPTDVLLDPAQTIVFLMKVLSIVT